MSSFFSDSLRNFIKIHFERKNFIKFISKATEVNVRQIQKMRKNGTQYDDVVAFKLTIDHRSRKLTKFHEKKLFKYLKKKFIAYLNEISGFLFDEFFISINESSIDKCLKKFEGNRKSMKRIILQRNQVLRDDGMRRLNEGTAKQLIFVNENVVCERIDKGRGFGCMRFYILMNMINDRKYGGASINKKVIIKQNLTRSKKGSILFAFIVNEYIACEIHQEFIIAAIFNDFILNQMLFQCTHDGDSRSVFVMNNAKIHGNNEFIQMCAKINVLLIKLFSYSSNFNFIEISFSVLKTGIKRHHKLNENYGSENEKYEQFFRDAVNVQNITFNAGNLFKTSGIAYFI